MYREETLLNVIRSVTRNGRSIILTAVLALILVYMFSIIGYMFFKDDFLVSVDEEIICAYIHLCEFLLCLFFYFIFSFSFRPLGHLQRQFPRNFRAHATRKTPEVARLRRQSRDTLVKVTYLLKLRRHDVKICSLGIQMKLIFKQKMKRMPNTLIW